MPLHPNQRLGSYEIVCPLGSGGMGEVYRARDSKLGRDVALKLLPPEVTNEPGRLERFDREARAIAALNHPHIVTIYSTEHVDGVRFLTMELVEGCTLADLVISTGMAVPRFLEIAMPLADALAAAHQKQITHRDLKPGNVMVSNDGRVKVLDFGLARVGGTGHGEALIETVAPITRQGMIVGTMPYMSPEQVEGHTIDARSDLFSLGVILYELLAGARPFTGSSSAALMSAILRDTPPAIGQRRADVPEALDRLVSRLMEKRPEDRLQTARDVFNELKHVRKHLDSGASGSSSSRRATGAAVTVAIRPFTARSADRLQPLAEGIAEDLATNLSRFSHLRVIARAEAARFVVEGTLRGIGSQVRITARLIDASSSAHVWADTIDCDVADPFAVQDETAARIAAAIGDEDGPIVHAVADALLARPIADLDLDELVLRFHLYTEQLDRETNRQLIAAFERQLDARPTHAGGWAVLSTLYAHTITQGFDGAPADVVLQQMRAADRAVALDSKNQQGWYAVALKATFARDLNALRDACDRVVAINPLSAQMTVACAGYLALAGDCDRAMQIYERCKRLLPHHQDWYDLAPMVDAFRNRRFAEVVRYGHRATMPGSYAAPLAAAAAAGELGSETEAQAAIDKLRRLRPEMLDPETARLYWQSVMWNDADVDDLVAGLGKALALVERRHATDKPRSDAGSPPSIAVLPFTDLSEKKDQDWFCDGIAEEIMNALAQLPGVRVAARASAFYFRGKADDLATIAERLQVATVLEGSVRRAGDRVRINAHLSDARQGRQLWSESFDRELKDIFDVQEDIARAIADRLRITIGGESAPLVPRITANMEAYQLLLKGRTLITKRGPAIAEAARCFEQAVAIDPQLADAHAGLADAYRLMGIYGIMRPGDAMPKVRASVERALAIDPDHADVLATLANVKHAFDWDFAAGRELTDRVLALAPNHVRTLAESSIMTATAVADRPGAQHVELIYERIRRSRELDPLNAWVMSVEALDMALIGRPDEAIAASARAIAADPENFTAHWSRVVALAAAGLDSEAVRAAEQAPAIFHRHPSILAELAAIRARQDHRVAAETIFQNLQETAKTSYVGAAVRAAVAASAGRSDDARELLAQAISERDAYLTFYKLPACRFLRDDPKCRDLLAEMGYVKNALR